MKTAIFVVIKDEQDYIEDFIRYHIDLGIDTLFVFEDIDSTSHYDICSKYPQVELHSVKELLPIEKIMHMKEIKRFQMAYIREGLMWIKNNFDYDWCFAIDSDEYITTTERFPEVLEAFQDYDGILLYWKNFNASGLVKKPIYDKPIYEIYTEECGYTDFDWKMRYITKMCYNMHTLDRKHIHSNHYALNNWTRTDGSKSRIDPPTFKTMYLRHYITKSFEEYKWKIEKRGFMCKNHRCWDTFFQLNKNMNKENLICL